MGKLAVLTFELKAGLHTHRLTSERSLSSSSLLAGLGAWPGLLLGALLGALLGDAAVVCC